MSQAHFDVTSYEHGIAAYIRYADEAATIRMIAYEDAGDTSLATPERLPRLGFLYESQGVAAFRRWLKDKNEANQAEIRQYFQNAFACWNTLFSIFRETSENLASPKWANLLHSGAQDDLLLPELALAFRIAITGLMGEKVSEVRLTLKRLSLEVSDSDVSWRDSVAERIFDAFVRLVRKADGWRDINAALSSINELRELQNSYEETYLKGQGDEDHQAIAAIELIGLYHLAQLITIVGEYLQEGKSSLARVHIKLDRHHDQALLAFENQQSPFLAHLTDLLWMGCRELVQNAIWTHVAHLSETTQRFVRALTDSSRSDPVLELWPSQQKAFDKHLLDTYPNAILVQMPTSAGKTLLAKFAIIQTKALKPNGMIAYIVPTRALVNQVTIELRDDFREILSVEQSVPAFELDPTEERLLKSRPDVLVTTPEKLDLLIRRNHPATQDMSMVVTDEAHNISDENRGARLELLLGTIKRDRAGVRFLLLSPFLPNDNELVTWLGEDRALPPISIDWKPNRKLVGAVSTVRRGYKDWLLEFETLPSAHALDVSPGMHIAIGPGTNQRTIKSITKATVHSLLHRGTILVLCAGKGTASSRATEIAEDMLPSAESSKEVESVCHYLEAEVGRHSNLIDCLRRGVTYHHAGLSYEARWLIEGLIRRGHVKVICGTTTLAQGVNFPITTVIIETLVKGNAHLSYQDFWNIAGRAGRTHVDTLGVVVCPVHNEDKLQEVKEFLKGDAQAIVSQLSALLEKIDDIAGQFNLSTLRNVPQLSALLQFLAHAMRVSGDENVADEVEDLLRASLIYHQVQKQDTLKARRLVDLCRLYLRSIRNERGLLEIADQTGFATPSVVNLLQQKRRDQELTSITNWLPNKLFGDDLQPLSKRIQAIADLPEMQLGTGTGQPFNAKRIAGILRDWVKGDTLSELTQKYSITGVTGSDEQVSEYSIKRLSGSAWLVYLVSLPMDLRRSGNKSGELSQKVMMMFATGLVSLLMMTGKMLSLAELN